ncbi:Wzz/FepE/Etk N-terminal domain-containing protein [Gammaproteobacteria bacterium]|nr:Wzz/FepE/Etk N-terminal domain-containing protein [Gammaproteobacteria bacterium]
MTSKLHEEIDLKEIFLTIWGKKLTILFTTFISTIIFLVYSLFLPNIYSSNAILYPTDKKEALSSKIGNISSLASFAGVDIDDKSSKTDEALKRIKSFQFFSEYFLPNINLEDIFAIEKWLPESDSVVYDKKIFDVQNKIWQTKNNIKPSKQLAFLKYKEFLKVAEDDKSFVTLSISHQSPSIAKSWLEIVIKNINESMREEDIDISKKSIDFLNSSSSKTNMQSLNQAIAALQESQMQNLMFISSNEFYIFKVIDAPIAPEFKTKPDRLIITVFGMLFGFVFSIAAILFSNSTYFKNT